MAMSVLVIVIGRNPVIYTYVTVSKQRTYDDKLIAVFSIVMSTEPKKNV
jgi:hypothetical protein